MSFNETYRTHAKYVKLFSCFTVIQSFHVIRQQLLQILKHWLQSAEIQTIYSVSVSTPPFLHQFSIEDEGYKRVNRIFSYQVKYNIKKELSFTHTFAKMSSIFFEFAFVCILEADSNSAARVCSFSQQISSGEKWEMVGRKPGSFNLI